MACYRIRRHPARSAWRAAILAALAATAMACQSGDDSDPASADRLSTQLLPDDAAILGKAYGQGARLPDGFYKDPRIDSQTSSSIHHIDSVSVLDPAAVTGETPRYELCSDDVAEAVAWSELADGYRTLGGDLVTTSENDRYFEFVRTPADVPGWVFYGRVFKCAYLDRRGATADTLEGPAGTLNRRPLDAAALRSLAEYLWTFSAWNNHAHVVLTSTGGGTATTLDHTLTMATRTPGAGTAGCDLVELRDWTLTADRQSGVVEASLQTLGSIESRMVDGQPERCR